MYGHHFGFGSMPNPQTICHADCRGKSLQLHVVYQMLVETSFSFGYRLYSTFLKQQPMAHCCLTSLGETLRCSHCSCALVLLELEQSPEAVPDPTWMSVYLSLSLLWSTNLLFSLHSSVHHPSHTVQWFCRNLDLVWIWFLSSLFSTLASSFMLNTRVLF